MSNHTNYRVEQTGSEFSEEQIDVDVCVVGGGMAGLFAAVSAARHGASVVLIHDRPVLGGNASSEIRMHICGAHGRNNKETGLLEEVQLENAYRNPTLNYSIWDSVLYGKAAFTPGVKLLLNTTCTGGTMTPKSSQGESRLDTITAWGLTTQTLHTIHAKMFIDSSGDSVLAPITGAKVRVGREAREEFDEDIEPEVADDRTMGNSLLVQLRESDSPQSFTPPTWAYKFLSESDLPNRSAGHRGDNFWWLELGGLHNTIRDNDLIRDELMKVGYGVVDYIKNHHPKKDQHANWGVEWMGSLPGKRENRRYVGDHVLTQNDVRAAGPFADIVAYGGWSMDDHHPAGLLYPGRPTIFHAAPSPYGIPFRSMYSVNVPNLLCAGRNLCATHAAMSSTRVMGTTSLMGQAVGTAAALCIEHACTPRELYERHVDLLQQTLMEDDQWLPGLSRRVNAMTRDARITAVGDTQFLRDGQDRPVGDVEYGWVGEMGESILFELDKDIFVGGLRLVLDSNLNDHKRMPSTIPLKGNQSRMPERMLRNFRVEVRQADGSWRVVHRQVDNHQRLVRVPLAANTSAVRLVLESTWSKGEGDKNVGHGPATIFSIDLMESVPVSFDPHEGARWKDVVAKVPAKDLEAPQTTVEETRGRSRGGA